MLFIGFSNHPQFQAIKKSCHHPSGICSLSANEILQKPDWADII